ncbi:hypothetical protein [Bowmanella dokdonensis]|uniref:Uncharacterized protein n=1 Tax=Bowmanella dokdonensis TaxID=751969 RepID=A0A939ISN6_9ALTE|nr:hypothetical protein [Bowmanella dokdonensis]MBN7826621.1 hypothetical protein [Bowmanella dokdonensis]
MLGFIENSATGALSMQRLCKPLAFLLIILSNGLQAHDYHGVHGMVIFTGQQALYASHLPLYHPPHDYQILYRIRLVGTDPKQVQSKLATHSLLTLKPTPFDLNRLIRKESFSQTATLYDGHFERDGEPLGEVTVHFEQALLVERLDPSIGQQNQYMVVSQDEDHFLLHRIASRPSFDHIVYLAAPLKEPPQLTDGSAETVRQQLVRQLPDSQQLYWETTDFK